MNLTNRTEYCENGCRNGFSLLKMNFYGFTNFMKKEAIYECSVCSSRKYLSKSLFGNRIKVRKDFYEIKQIANLKKIPICDTCLGTGTVLVTDFTCKHCNGKNFIGMRNFQGIANYAYDDTCKHCGWAQGRTIISGETEANCPKCNMENY